VLTTALITAGSIFGPADLAAQPGILPPNRFFGTLTLGGQPAPAGTQITATIGGVVCGARSTADAGRYQIDVVAASERPGCGTSGAAVSFRAGDATANETGTWAAGQFTRLNLSAGAGGGGDFEMARLDLESPCIPVAGQPVCDDERRRLWAADPVAWGAVLAARGRPNPTPEQVFDEALSMRLDARDPAAQSALTRLMGWAHPRITALRFRGTAPAQADEWVEITNLGGAAQTMGGFVLRAQPSGAEYVFPSSFTLEPGTACRVYAAEPGPRACPGSFGRGAVWDDTAGTAVLIYAPVDWTVDSPSYSAPPDRQPPPPNLRGVR
jgi:hypothetical protein